MSDTTYVIQDWAGLSKV